MKPPKHPHKHRKCRRLQRQPANQHLDAQVSIRPLPLGRAGDAAAAALHQRAEHVARHEDARQQAAVQAQHFVARVLAREDRLDEAPDQEVVAGGDEDGREDDEREGCCEGALVVA